MEKFSFYVVSGLVLLILLKTGCSDIENVTAPNTSPMIKSVIPAHAPYGARVMIGGTGFGTSQDNLEILFNESKAIAEELNDSTILTRVPKGATTGPLEVIVNGKTLTGPSFTVDSTTNLWLEVTDVNPTKGGYGEPVEIMGTGFNPDPTMSKVYFGETLAEINTASDTLLTTVVPDNAQSGPVMVVTDQDTAVGPTFTVQKPHRLQVTVMTGGTEIDSDGYVFSVTNKDDQHVLVNDEVIYKDIYESEVQVTISNVASNCRILEANPQNVTLSTESMATVTFNVDCTKDLRGYIVYTSDLHSNSEVYMRNVDGSVNQRITETAGVNESSPVISPDGLQIAYDAYADNGSHIFIMDSDGSNVTQITKTAYNFSPAWNPTGNKLAFEKGSEIMDIYTIDTDGSNLQSVIVTSGYSEDNPDWSPDGSRILYESYEDGDLEIYSVKADGTGRQQVTINSVRDSEGEWSPDGNKITFIQEAAGSSPIVYTANSDGTGITELTKTKGLGVSSPSWAPGGDQIAYSVQSDGVYQIYIYSLDQDSLVYTPWVQGNDREPDWNYK